MKFSQKLFDFYIDSSLHVSLSVISLCIITYMEFGRSVDINLLIFIFFCSLCGYNFIKYMLPSASHSKEQPTMRILLLAVSCLGFLISIFKVDFEIIFLSILLGFLTFFYAVPFAKQKNLRMVAGAKIFVVALVWSGVTVLMPLLNDGISFNWNIGLTFFQRILIVVVLMIPFELRDMNSDSILLKTLPRQIGIQKTKILGWVLLVLVLLMELLKSVGNAPYYSSLMAFTIILVLIIKISSIHQQRYFSSFYVEALPIIWLLIMWAIRIY